MAIATFTTGDFSINSSWQCEWTTVKPTGIPSNVPKSVITAGKKLVFKSGYPTWESNKVTFNFSLPSGARVNNAKVFATCSNVFTGYSVLNVNGNQMKKVGSQYVADVTLGAVGGIFNALFNFKANGNMVDTEIHYASIVFRNVYLQVDYTIPNFKASERSGSNETLNIPPQSVCVFDQTTGKIYMFDGVIRIQHQLTMKIEEEPSKKQDEYVNNARNEPDKVTLDVVMSDVHTGGSAFDESASLSTAQTVAKNSTKTAVETVESRSANAFAILHALKESRQKLAVITPQYVHVDMIIASVVGNQDETCPYGWTGQVVFQHAYEKKEEIQNNSNAKTGGDVERIAAAVSAFADADKTSTQVPVAEKTIQRNKLTLTTTSGKEKILQFVSTSTKG